MICFEMSVDSTDNLLDLMLYIQSIKKAYKLDNF